MKQIDWTRLVPRPSQTTDQQRISYLVTFLTKARSSEKTKQRAIRELGKLRKDVDVEESTAAHSGNDSLRDEGRAFGYGESYAERNV